MSQACASRRHPGIRQTGSRARTRRASAAPGTYRRDPVAMTEPVAGSVIHARHVPSAARSRARSAGIGPRPGTSAAPSASPEEGVQPDHHADLGARIVVLSARFRPDVRGGRRPRNWHGAAPGVEKDVGEQVGALLIECPFRVIEALGQSCEPPVDPQGVRRVEVSLEVGHPVGSRMHLHAPGLPRGPADLLLAVGVQSQAGCAGGSSDLRRGPPPATGAVPTAHALDDLLDHLAGRRSLEGRDLQDEHPCGPRRAPAGLHECHELRVLEQLTGRHDPVVGRCGGDAQDHRELLAAGIHDASARWAFGARWPPDRRPPRWRQPRARRSTTRTPPTRRPRPVGRRTATPEPSRAEDPQGPPPRYVAHCMGRWRSWRRLPPGPARGQASSALGPPSGPVRRTSRRTPIRAAAPATRFATGHTRTSRSCSPWARRRDAGEWS